MKHAGTIKLIRPLALFAFILAGAALSAADFDFGATLHNGTAFEKQVQGENAALNQQDSAALWFETGAPFSGSGRISLAGQLAYEFTNNRAMLFNLDYFRVFGWMPGALGTTSVLEFTAGRFPFADPSAMILNHTADGVKVRALYPSFVLDFSGAYTGLLLNPKSEIRMTAEDWSDKANETDNAFGPKRIIADATISFLDLGGVNNLSLYGIAQFDGRSGSKSTKIDTQYLGISVSRLIGSNAYSDFFFNAEMGQIKAPDQKTRLTAGFLTGMKLKYIREDWKASLFEFGLLAAPPDFDTSLIKGVNVGVIGYLPVSQPSLGINVSPQMNALALAEAKYSFRPFMGSANLAASRFQADIAGRAYFRTWSVGVNWIGTDPASDSLFIGSELECGFNWRILSDVGIGLDSAVFLPASGSAGAVVSGMDPMWTVRLDLSVSL